MTIEDILRGFRQAEKECCGRATDDDCWACIGCECSPLLKKILAREEKED